MIWAPIPSTWGNDHAMEEAFGISIADEDAEKIKKVQDAWNYIEAHAK